ncbi:MAG TPA: hypothetical protein VF677_10085 [Flavobacterium sp.]|jgi:hypothetical protein
MKVNPLLLFKATVLFFLFLAIAILYLIIKLNVATILGYAVMILIILLLSYVFMALTGWIKISKEKYAEIESRRDQLLYQKYGFIIKKPILNENLHINWEDIEAIYLRQDTASREGDYHSKEYIVFLNKKPKTIIDKDASWINKISLFSNKENNITNILINDYKNKDFSTFAGQLIANLNIQDFSVQDNRKGFLISKETNLINNKIIEHWKPHKNPKFLIKIFDLDNTTNNNLLLKYRSYTDNKN